MSAKKEGIVDFYLRHAKKYTHLYGERTLVLMQTGSFFEVYDRQSPDVSPHMRCCRDVLGILVTRKDKSDPTSAYMAGIPTHAMRRYYKTLLRAGYTIVCVTQRTPPPHVLREVTQILSPGCSLSEDVHESSESGQSALLALLIEEDEDGECFVHACRFDTNLGTTQLRTLHSAPPTSPTVPGAAGARDVADRNAELFAHTKELLDSWQFHECLLAVQPAATRCESGRDDHEPWRERLVRAFGLRGTLVHFHQLDAASAYRLTPTFQRQFLERLFAAHHSPFATIHETLGLQHAERAAIANLVGMLEFVEKHDRSLVQNLPIPQLEDVPAATSTSAESADLPPGAAPLFLQTFNEVYEKLNIFHCRGDASRSLFQYCNCTRSKLGERLLHRRLAQPLLDGATLERRYDLVSALLDDPADDALPFLARTLRNADLERIYRRFGMAKLQPYEVPRIVMANDNIARINAYLAAPDDDAACRACLAREQPRAAACEQFAAYAQEVRDLFALEVCKDTSLTNLPPPLALSSRRRGGDRCAGGTARGRRRHRARDCARSGPRDPRVHRARGQGRADPSPQCGGGEGGEGRRRQRAAPRGDGRRRGRARAVERQRGHLARRRAHPRRASARGAPRSCAAT